MTTTPFQRRLIILSVQHVALALLLTGLLIGLGLPLFAALATPANCFLYCLRILFADWGRWP